MVFLRTLIAPSYWTINTKSGELPSQVIRAIEMSLRSESTFYE